MAEDVTQLLARLSQGQNLAAEKLVPIVYNELRRLASALLKGERPDHTLQTTALVNEAYLRLVDQRSAQCKDRAHFFAVAAQAMRRILIDHARRRGRDKRGGGRPRLPLDSAMGLTIDSSSNNLDLIALDCALVKLSQLQPLSARVVEMKYFAGLSFDDIALALDVSDRAVEREWRYARAWLFNELGGNDETL